MSESRKNPMPIVTAIDAASGNRWRRVRPALGCGMDEIDCRRSMQLTSDQLGWVSRRMVFNSQKAAAAAAADRLI
jgi:hypothetical protein